jgi:hypothetical protein
MPIKLQEPIVTYDDSDRVICVTYPHASEMLAKGYSYDIDEIAEDVGAAEESDIEKL